MDIKEREQKNTHNGHAVKRVRNAMGMKQEVLADAIGLSQTQVSYYEQQRVIEDPMLNKFAIALNVSPELLKELEEDPVTFIIENNTFENSNVGKIERDSIINNNPVEQLIVLCKENQNLYERLLESEKEKVRLLEKLLDGKG